ncbi:helix-turn-helix domain-containing protein [Conchiformibius kuhniae]|uniref:Helix-turn-helix domain-containing protein n=1 Tax=Conchiformibius kuhniae TaxID=211502 RepID=A0A8T9MWK5_9NEIS|nr:helix-turn-helix domain-containing protein [Conchiformibius kuhniae]UOP05534.1 helix-turn-helix domain-containing protein [Conchiformibius kuhniae]
METCEKIRLLRKERELSQKDMAEKLQMSVNGYSKIERGETEPNLQRLKQIADVFGVSPRELVPQGSNNVVCFINHGTYTGNTFANDERQTHQQLLNEIEKLNLVIAHKDELLVRQERELADLRKMLAFLDNNKS